MSSYSSRRQTALPANAFKTAIKKFLLIFVLLPMVKVTLSDFLMDVAGTGSKQAKRVPRHSPMVIPGAECQT